MTQKHWVIILAVFLGGCVSVQDSSVDNVEPSVAATKLLDLNSIRSGMSYDEVKAILVRPVTLGYDIPEEGGGQLKEYSLSNIYRAETITIDGKNYLVEYYITHTIKADDIVSEDELTPLVFENSKLIGKGKDFLFKLKNQ